MRNKKNSSPFGASKIISLILVVVMAGITSCSKANNSKGATAEDVVNSYMKYVKEGEYKKAAKLTNEDELNISQLFDLLDKDQTKVIEFLLSNVEYEISDADVNKNKASVDLELTYFDYETLYERFVSSSEIWELDEFLDALSNFSDTAVEKYELELVKDGDNWVIESDVEITDFLYDWVEGFEVTNERELTPDGLEDYLSSVFSDPQCVLELINSGDVDYVLSEEMFSDENRLEFLTEYLDYFDWDLTIDSVDEENRTIDFTIDASVLSTAEYLSRVLSNRDVATVAIAYTYASPYLDEEADVAVPQKYVDAFIDAFYNCPFKTKSISLTASLNESGEYVFSGNLADVLFSTYTDDEITGLTSDDYTEITYEALEYAYDNDFIDDELYNRYKESLRPSHANEYTLYVENDVFYMDFTLFGMRYYELNEYFGGDLPETQVWEWDGYYDSYFDYTFNGNQYTFFFYNDYLCAVRYEIVAGDIYESTLNGYNSMFGAGDVLCDEYGNYIPRGLHNSGMRFYYDDVYVDVFINIYDDISHVAMHYSLW